jgi:hypothetical protein
MGTGFAVLLAFVIFLSFSSYARARDKASVKAVAISQLFRTANLVPPDWRRQLHGELACYARAVITEWRTMRNERENPLVDGWLAESNAQSTGSNCTGESSDSRSTIVRPGSGATGWPATGGWLKPSHLFPDSSGWRSSSAAG